MSDFVTYQIGEVCNYRIQFALLHSHDWNIAVAIAKCLLYMWHHCIITVLVLLHSIKHAAPGF